LSVQRLETLNEQRRTHNEHMKIAIAGKGGTGKTTLSAGLCLSFAEEGKRVLAVDADSNNCLGYALGFPQQVLERVAPLSEMKEDLRKRAGAADSGGYFLLSPEVSDLLDKHAVEYNGIRLLVMGTISEPGGGCVCPESVVLRALTRHLVGREEVVILDLEAGIEHLGRGTARHVDWLVIMVEPNAASMRTAQRIAGLAKGLGIPKIGIAANRVKRDEEKEEVFHALPGLPLLGAIPYDLALENTSFVPWENDEVFRRAISEIKAGLMRL